MQLRKWGFRALILRPVTYGKPLRVDSKRVELSSDALDLPNLRYDIPGELSALQALLAGIGLKGVEIQHFLGLDARVIDAVRSLPVPYDVMVHDYSWICPRVTLIDGSGRYCGEPAVTVCQACVRRNGSSLDEKISVPALRARSASWLRGARRVMAPSEDAAARMRRHFRDLTVAVQPHALPYLTVPKVTAPLDNRRARIALVGAIGNHKGYEILLACARDARARPAAAGIRRRRLHGR